MTFSGFAMVEGVDELSGGPKGRLRTTKCSWEEMIREKSSLRQASVLAIGSMEFLQGGHFLPVSPYAIVLETAVWNSRILLKTNVRSTRESESRRKKAQAWQIEVACLTSFGARIRICEVRNYRRFLPLGVSPRRAPRRRG